MVDQTQAKQSETNGYSFFIFSLTNVPPKDIKGAAKSLTKGLYLHSFSNNPLMSPSPYLDVRTILNMNEITEDGKKWLWVQGIAMTKGFPAFELFLEDASGRRVFLYVQDPVGEDQLAYELIAPKYDRRRVINLKLEINTSGNFVYPNGLIKTAELNANVSLVAPPKTFISCPNIGFNQTVAFNPFTPGVSYINWNNDFLNRSPGDDCLVLPCNGNLGNFGSPTQCE